MDARGTPVSQDNALPTALGSGTVEFSHRSGASVVVKHAVDHVDPCGPTQFEHRTGWQNLAARHFGAPKRDSLDPSTLCGPLKRSTHFNDNVGWIVLVPDKSQWLVDNDSRIIDPVVTVTELDSITRKSFGKSVIDCCVVIVVAFAWISFCQGSHLYGVHVYYESNIGRSDSPLSANSAASLSLGKGHQIFHDVSQWCVWEMAPSFAKGQFLFLEFGNHEWRVPCCLPCFLIVPKEHLCQAIDFLRPQLSGNLPAHLVGSQPDLFSSIQIPLSN
mmetsp:Transcript_7652/g.22425  ORF Transcript_7652/g.22425 Transcript_7652/m.22425 type:complete len:274 (-) Transcript_7652:3487-4308(-)